MMRLRKSTMTFSFCSLLPLLGACHQQTPDETIKKIQVHTPPPQSVSPCSKPCTLTSPEDRGYCMDSIGSYYCKDGKWILVK